MPPGLHFFLLRFAHYFCLLLGISLAAWFWKESIWMALFLFFLPGLLAFVFLPVFFQARIRALCPGCASPVPVSGKKRDHGFTEYIYRCDSCTFQHHTGVFFKEEPVKDEAASTELTD